MWSPLIRLSGTAYRLHPLFVLLMAASVMTGYFLELITLFGVVLIHELGHVAAAKSFGWRVREVKLLPFGGVAEVDESTNIPAREEFLVAMAGPLQNAWMAVFALLMKKTGWGDGAYWSYFYEANVWIGCFNLMPILPLDGGKMLQAALSYVVSFHRAMVFSVRLSLFLSVMIVTGAVIRLNGGGIHMNLLVIGLFLLYSNWYGYKHIPFLFLRFLVNRERRVSRGGAGARPKAATPIIVDGARKPVEVFRLFMREQYHYIYVTGAAGALLEVMPEEKLLRAYFADAGRPASRSARPPPRRP